MYKRLFCSAIIFGAAALAPPLAAQTPSCMPREVLTETLADTYSERLAGAGLQGPTQLLEVWTSPSTGSFTVFVTRPDGWSCVMATGTDWISPTISEAPEGTTSH